MPENDERKPSCDKCAFYDTQNSFYGKGRCKRFPPVQSLQHTRLEPTNNGSGSYGVAFPSFVLSGSSFEFPEMENYNWCGEFVDKVFYDVFLALRNGLMSKAEAVTILSQRGLDNLQVVAIINRIK